MIALLNQKPRISVGAEREIVSKRKKSKRKLRDIMLPNLSGIKFEDAVKKLLQTPPPKDGKKP
ncbi:MAG TPA: hypothetical protein VHG89_04300 [Verrucomicrobiae bacterium]|nr:hypothetical protein [Verrucomicrobiae bacterium]